MLYAAIDVQGRPRTADGTGGSVAYRSVTPRYFAALGIPALRGRGFQEADRDPDRNVVILSDAPACRMFPNQDPLGKQIRPGRSGPWLTVIGVVGDVKNNGLVERADPEYYQVRKHAPGNTGRGATVIFRSAADPGRMAALVRAEIAALDATAPVQSETMHQRIGKLAVRPRNALLLGIFAGMGLVPAAIGLYSVISFQVAQRTQEIGVRMALGATPGAIARLVLRHAALWTAVGAALGVIGSLFLLRLLRGMLFGVSPQDPRILACALMVLSAAALLAAWMPSRRAARVDPMEGCATTEPQS